MRALRLCMSPSSTRRSCCIDMNNLKMNSLPCKWSSSDDRVMQTWLARRIPTNSRIISMVSSSSSYAVEARRRWSRCLLIIIMLCGSLSWDVVRFGHHIHYQLMWILSIYRSVLGCLSDYGWDVTRAYFSPINRDHQVRKRFHLLRIYIFFIGES